MRDYGSCKGYPLWNKLREKQITVETLHNGRLRGRFARARVEHRRGPVQRRILCLHQHGLGRFSFSYKLRMNKNAEPQKE